jgi:uncharacterized protein YbaA (DUF1428 family)
MVRNCAPENLEIPGLVLTHHPGMTECDDENVKRKLVMPYVDGFIVPVPKKNLEAYSRISKKCGKVWREYGALDYREWVADDVKVGTFTSFPRSVKLKPGETVVFAWITYKSRAQRDKINAKVMADPRLKEMFGANTSPPFDGERMIYGGFESLVKV